MSLKRKILVVALCICWIGNEGKSALLNSMPSIANTNEFSGRIIEGKIAPGGSFPYQVSLRNNSGHFCSGSILNKRWILTAARCLEGVKNDDVTIFAGTNTLNSGGKAYQSVKVVSHPEFDKIKTINDVGLVKVGFDIKFDKKVQRVELAKKDFDLDDAIAVHAGWGYNKKNESTLSNDLLYYTSSLLSKDKCAKLEPTVIGSTQICTLNHSGQGACRGDFGGPLHILANKVQIGISSYLIEGCADGHPNIFTRVYPYLGWINEQISKYA